MFDLLAIDYREPLWLAVAFLFGVGARSIGLPPLVGFLAAGFALNFGIASDDSASFLSQIADHGVTLLLFTIGLKLRVSSLIRPEIWGVSIAHMLGSTLLVGAMLFGMAYWGIIFNVSEMDFETAILIGFALSFSSTVFVVKILEDNGETGSRYGQLAIGVLVMQDLAAVAFLAISAGKIPSIWALGLLALIPLRGVFFVLLRRVGHGELLILFGIVMALGSSALFEQVGMKGDLGALVMGALLGSSEKSRELAKSLMAFKEIFLIGFFLSIGMAGLPDMSDIGIAMLLLLFIPLKVLLFFALFTRFRVRMRNAVLASGSLGNYSEFGLIVISGAVVAGMLDSRWLIVTALTVSFSFVLASLIQKFLDPFMQRYWEFLHGFEDEQRLPGDEAIDMSRVHVMVFGLGRVGGAAYETLREDLGDAVVAIDHDPMRVEKYSAKDWNVLQGDPGDFDFWERVGNDIKHIELVVLALSSHTSHLAATHFMRTRGYKGQIVAVARYQDQISELESSGVDHVYSVAQEVGIGFSISIRQEYPHLFNNDLSESETKLAQPQEN
jgi:predicted Kef-type K+ transport protein